MEKIFTDETARPFEFGLSILLYFTIIDSILEEVSQKRKLEVKYVEVFYQ